MKQPIDISDLREEDGLRFEKPLPAHQRMKEPVIDGYACMYDKAHLNGRTGQIEVFLPGCFATSLRSGQPIEFQLEHDSANVLGNTRDHLALVDRPEGLAFRMRLPKTMIGYITSRMLDNSQKCDMSVGYHVRGDTHRDIAGHSVRFITAAELLEISLVKRGAVAHAFAYLSDADIHAQPTIDKLSGRFELMHSLHKAIAAVRACTETFQAYR